MAKTGVSHGIANRVRTWLIEALGGTALGSLAYGSNEDIGWRPITERVARGYRRDLDPLSQQQQLKVAHFLYTSNALAQFLINVPVALTVGRRMGYTLAFNHDLLGITREQGLELASKARRFLDPWWEHPAHDLAGGAQRYGRTYLVTGELLLVIPDESVNPTTGLFTLDYIDSALIESVEGKGGLATTPGRVAVRASGQGPRFFDVMLPTPDGQYVGQCFFFRHTGLLNSLHGRSDLLAQADWIDLHDQLLFNRTDKAILSNTLVHDLKIENVQNDDEIRKRVKEFVEATRKPGGTFGHSEKVTHEIKTANLNESDNAVLLRHVLLYVLGSKGYPEHWFADAGSSNRASAVEQSEIALKVLEELQEEFLRIFTALLVVAYDRLAAKQSIFPARDTGAVSLRPDLPKLSERDISRVGGVIVNVEAALDSAVAAGRISRRTAMRITLGLVEKLTGERVDPDDEQVRIEVEKAEAEALEQERRNAAMKAATDLADQLVDEGAGDGQGEGTVGAGAGASGAPA